MEREKPHTRQKAKLLAQKKVQCGECSKMIQKRHTLQCFHCFCHSCYPRLSQVLHRFRRGVRCSVCNTFDPFTSSVERDDSHLTPCKLHPNKKYIFYCTPCKTRVCYSCKMGKHYKHEVELLQDKLDRTREQVESEKSKRQAEAEEKVQQNERQIAAIQRKEQQLGRHLEEHRIKLEQALKQHYLKLRNMVTDQAEQRKRVLEAHNELIKYFQEVRLPHHSRGNCPQQGAIRLHRPPSLKDPCRAAPCLWKRNSMKNGHLITQISAATNDDKKKSAEHNEIEIGESNRQSVASQHGDKVQGNANKVTEKAPSTEQGVNYTEVLSSQTVSDIGEIFTYNEVCFVRFTPANIDAQYLLDKLDFDDNGNIIDSKTGNIMTDNLLGKVETVHQPIKQDPPILEIIHKRLVEKAEKEHAQNPSKLEDTCPCDDKVNFIAGDCNIRSPKTGLASLDNSKIEYNGSISLDSKLNCNRMLCMNENMWLVYSDDNSSITVINKSGEVVKTLQSNGVSEISSLHPLNSHQILVAARSGLHVIDSDGDVICKLMKGSFADVCCYGSQVAMLEREESHAKVLDVSRDPPCLMADFHVFPTGGPVQSLVLQGESVFLGCSDQRMKKYSLQGELMWQWGGPGSDCPGEMVAPLLGAVDSSESLLVVDRGNRRLQLVDSHCQWKVLSLPEVSQPSDVVLTNNGLLYVLNSRDSTVLCYTLL